MLGLKTCANTAWLKTESLQLLRFLSYIECTYEKIYRSDMKVKRRAVRKEEGVEGRGGVTKKAVRRNKIS